jgi:hypothetical protein
LRLFKGKAMQFKRFNLIFTLALLVLASCAKEQKPDLSHWLSSEYNFSQAWVQTVAPPASIASGTPATFSVSYMMPSPCYFLVGIKTYQDDFSINLLVLLDQPYPPPICADVLVGKISQFQVLFPRPGTYTINFKGINGPESIQVNVN